MLNQRLTSSFSPQPLLSSRNSVCWFGMNFSEETNEFVLEKLAARFKTEDIVCKFEEVVITCASRLNTTSEGELAACGRI